jgi:hypothetical protein
VYVVGEKGSCDTRPRYAFVRVSVELEGAIVGEGRTDIAMA